MHDWRAVRRVLWVTMGLNLVAMAAKLIVGYQTGALSLIADGFDSVFDAASNVVGLVGIYVAARPADEDHPYGHRKAETMTALIISSLLFLTTWELIKSAIARLRDPTLIEATVNLWSFGALLISIAVHGLVVWYELRAGRRLHSDVLVADALHTRADIFVSLSVIGGLIAVHLGFPLADPILTLAIAVAIAKIGIDIIREESPTLMDRVVMPVEGVRAVVEGVPGVLSCHRVRSRGHETAVYVDLHIQIDPAVTIEQGHATAHEVQRRLRERFPNIEDVTVHAEPAGPLSVAQEREVAAATIHRLAEEMGIDVHDVWVYESGGRQRADVHAQVDGALSLRQAHDLVSELEARAQRAVPGLVEFEAHIEPRELPFDTGDGRRVRGAVERVIAAAWRRGACHALRVRRSAAGWSVAVHCALPGEVSLTEAHRASTELEGELRKAVPGLERVVIHTEPAEGDAPS